MTENNTQNRSLSSDSRVSRVFVGWTVDEGLKEHHETVRKNIESIIHCVFCVNKTKGCSFAFKKRPKSFHEREVMVRLVTYPS